MLIVSLIEEDILPIVALSGVLLQHTISADTMLQTELLPKLIANWYTQSKELVRDCRQSGVKVGTYFGYHIGRLEE